MIEVHLTRVSGLFLVSKRFLIDFCCDGLPGSPFCVTCMSRFCVHVCFVDTFSDGLIDRMYSWLLPRIALDGELQVLFPNFLPPL